jgi:glycogen synthase
MPTRLLLTADVVGGVWDFVLALARELHTRRAADVTILALGEPAPAQTEQALGAGARLLVEAVKLEWMNDCQDDVLRTRELISRHVHDVQPDVLHANQFAAACADVDVPVVLTLHSDVLSWRRWTLGQSETPPEWSAYESLAGEALTHADRLVAVSAFLAEEVRALYGCRRDIRVIHNGWSPPEPAAANTIERAPTRTRTPLPAGQRARSTLTGGRAWDAAKNVPLVVEAAEGWNPGPVYFAGQQVNPESGGRCAVPSAMQTLGFLSPAALADTMRATRIYLSAARYDPFGLLPLQAACNGCALLLSDIPSYRELWEGAAVFFRSDDAMELRQQWSRLLDQPDLARHLATRARQRAVERYSLARMADSYAELYGSLSAVAT